MKNHDLLYKEIAEQYNKATADAAAEFYSLFTDDIYKWLAGLWDKEIGGFYYSCSARDNEYVEVGDKKILLLPDIESTDQAFDALVVDGIAKDKSDFPVKMKDKAVKFITSCQDPTDGYFYHKQWWELMLANPTSYTSRRARDMNKGMSTVRAFGGRSLYPTAIERIKSAANAGETEKKESTVPEHLRSKEAFAAYLQALDINGEGRSYGVGHNIGQQSAEIKAAGLADVCIDFLNSTQRPNGLWEDDLNFTTSNGLMKISLTYRKLGRCFPRVTEAFGAALEIACQDGPIDGLTTVYNPPATILTLFDTLDAFYDETTKEKCRKMLTEKAAIILKRSAEKVAPFKEPDGSFSYLVGHPPVRSQGMPVCIPGLPESDVNANALAQGARTMTFDALGIRNEPIFDEKDAKIFYEIAGEA